MWFWLYWYGNQTQTIPYIIPPPPPSLPNQRHEIERLTVWQNPISLPDHHVPGEEEVTSWINPTQSDRHWRSTIVMAFQASPHLAFHMINRLGHVIGHVINECGHVMDHVINECGHVIGHVINECGHVMDHVINECGHVIGHVINVCVVSRFRSLDVVTREVTRLVCSDPVPFHTIPEAAQLLARRDVLGVEPVATELYHLLYWRNVSPASTLIFFYRPFSHHPITAQFASKAMQSFKPVSQELNHKYIQWEMG